MKLLAKTFFCRIIVFLIAGLLTVSAFGGAARAAIYTVTNTADDGAGSLRQAIGDANSTPDADTINFNIPATDPNCAQNGVCTITLTGGVLTVQVSGGALNIVNAAGAGKLHISGNNASRVFLNLGADLTLDGLTITRGTSPANEGAVNNTRGTLTVKNSVLTQNTGFSAIYSLAFQTNGVLNVSNTTVSNNVGTGIYATNGLSLGGTANITNSTISNNQAANANSGGGGGILFLGDRMDITNSTVSGNSNGEGGAINAVIGRILLTNCTVTNNSAGNGGGIRLVQSEVRLRNTIVAGNTSSATAPSPDFYFPNNSGSVLSLGNNLIGDSTNIGNPRATWLSTDIRDQPARLLPLANNGGATQTHAFLRNSSALNAGNNCVLTLYGCGDDNPSVTTDQRGALRVGTVDIGAFELAPSVAFDFDGDRKADASVFRPSNGFWYLNRSSEGFGAVQFGIAADKLVPGNYDGDGKADFAVYRENTWYLLKTLGGFNAIQFGAAGDIPLTADFDGDGLDELTVFRPSNGTWYVLNLGNTFTSSVQFGTNGDKPLPADYDGDGKADLAVYRPSTGDWHIARPGNFDTVHFGVSSDAPVPADYDGDGKTDPAVYRPSEGTWYLLGSAQGFTAVQFGISTDLPVPADYDGDNKTDIAVYRENTWYLLQSTGGFTGFQFGAAGDKPVPNSFVR